MSGFSEKFTRCFDSDFYIITKETRHPTKEELVELENKYNEVRKLRDEINRLQDSLHLLKREAEAFANKIYGMKNFKVKKNKTKDINFDVFFLLLYCNFKIV